MKYPPWKFNATVAAGCLLVGGADLGLRHWWEAPVMAGAAGVNTLIARSSYRRVQQTQREARRPDYAKIRRLEIELGLVEPPPVSDLSEFAARINAKVEKRRAAAPGTYCECGTVNAMAHMAGCPRDLSDPDVARQAAFDFWAAYQRGRYGPR